MKIREIREMSSDELLKRIIEEENNLVDLRFSHELKQLTNTAKLRSVKKDIAKMRTILRERQSKEESEKKEPLTKGENK
ncbi:MAG: 50S ribosomal protein L29 [Ignavibacteriales bacterium]|jgi:large subunit ribosomal protein L29|nr:50S ribosomal protein L29 [Ignavibacteriaceae bacterium]NLH62105.1 50S ribosomal protein L29 [Ignavibacteriales bacterium]HOJ17805.1 50S ribosomal protein L29 [Ignavibacteriaceae bacterium]